MENNQKQYWASIEELSNDTEFIKQAQNEFPGYLSVKDKPNSKKVPSDGVSGSNRRDFLKLMGFGLAAATLASCNEAPIRKAIPFLNKPEEIDPGLPNYYASTYVDSAGGYSTVLVKTREGRPIKIEPNTLSRLTPIGTHTRAQASLLTLYDKERIMGPMKGGRYADWNQIDGEIRTQLQRASGQGGIRIVSSSIMSPTSRRVISEFISRYPGTQHIVYDANSVSGMIQANQATFGSAVVPFYDFSRANVIVSIGADFLGTWLYSHAQNYQYTRNRKLGRERKEMSRHYQFETNLSLTGANADYRTPIRPSQTGLVVAALYNQIARQTGGTPVNAPAVEIPNLAEAAADLLQARGRALVVSGSNDVNVQVMVNAINRLLGAYDNQIINLNRPLNLKQGNDNAMATFVQDVANGRVGAVIFYNANPVYDHPAGAALGQNLGNIGLSISMADRVDETAALCQYICPDHHYLEAWNDAEPIQGYYSLGQPTISPLFKTRAAQESLLNWAGAQQQDYYTYLRNTWRTTYFPLRSGELAGLNFEDFWVRVLHDGIFEPQGNAPAAPATAAQIPATQVDVAAAAANIGSTYQAAATTVELTLYEKIGIGNGAQANNPWLQELPDPISRACWDNYLMVPKRMANDLELNPGDIVRIEAADKPAVELPVLIQPGQAEGTVSAAIGYGRVRAGRAANNVGANVYPLATLTNGTLSYYLPDVRITKTGGNREIALVQKHHTIMARPVVQEAKLTEYQSNPAAGRYKPKIATSVGPQEPGEITIWNEHTFPNHSWGMVIDLNSCTGCGACVISCNVENNVAVVGRQEVINSRDMHWIRIDRYYSSDADPEDRSISGYQKLEEASANPKVVFQPMLCQHCKNAPCESVCPVLATVHSSEGLNQMAYNRCIGTRYCANNCPYKVRRFNWFKYFNNEEFPYHLSNDLGKMVLNPDVTVRARGVMEKCTFCVQRIQAGKLQAKIERRRPIDGEIVTACASACPNEAITFGDLNDPESRVARLREAEHQERAFQVLEEINTKPQISYLTKIRNEA